MSPWFFSKYASSSLCLLVLIFFFFSGAVITNLLCNGAFETWDVRKQKRKNYYSDSLGQRLLDAPPHSYNREIYKARSSGKKATKCFLFSFLGPSKVSGLKHSGVLCFFERKTVEKGEQKEEKEKEERSASPSSF